MGAALATDTMDPFGTEFSALMLEAIRQSSLDAELQTEFI